MGTLCSGTVNNYTNSTCTLYLILFIINVPFWEEKITDPVLTQSVELTLIGPGLKVVGEVKKVGKSRNFHPKVGKSRNFWVLKVGKSRNFVTIFLKF